LRISQDCTGAELEASGVLAGGDQPVALLPAPPGTTTGIAVLVTTGGTLLVQMDGQNLTAVATAMPAPLHGLVWRGASLIMGEDLVLVGERPGHAATEVAVVSLKGLHLHHVILNSTVASNLAGVTEICIGGAASAIALVSQHEGRMFLLSTTLQPLMMDLVQDPGHEWGGICGTKWLTNDDGGESEDTQLIAVRVGNLHSHFSVDLLVYGSAARLERRTRGLAEVQGTQEFKTTWVDSGPYLPGISHPLNTELVKRIWTDTHINTFDYYVCGAEGPTPNSYDDFVNVLNATQNFSVDGRQFRVWLEVAPGSEAIEDGCQVPHDHPLTHFNETSLFNASVGCE
jgi:hypothetical protein